MRTINIQTDSEGHPLHIFHHLLSVFAKDNKSLPMHPLYSSARTCIEPWSHYHSFRNQTFYSTIYFLADLLYKETENSNGIEIVVSGDFVPDKTSLYYIKIIEKMLSSVNFKVNAGSHKSLSNQYLSSQRHTLAGNVNSFKAQGNYWLALNIAKNYMNRWQDSFIHGLLSDIYIGLEDEESAFRHGIQCYHAAFNPQERLGSCYRMAMLSGRRHKNPNEEDAQGYLVEADEIIKKKEVLLTDQIKIANAWAYFYMKKGELSKSLKLMEAPLIKNFIREASSVRDLDIAEVLNANYAKLLMVKGDNRIALQKLKQIVNKNPGYPVYYLDLARCLLSVDHKNEAHEILDHAISRFPCLPDFHTMKMQLTILGSDENYRHAKLANRFNVRDEPGPVLNLAASLLSREQVCRAKTLVESLNFEELGRKHAEDFSILKTEILIKEKSISEAHNYLCGQVNLLPNSNLLKENLTILQGLL